MKATSTYRVLVVAGLVLVAGMPAVAATSPHKEPSMQISKNGSRPSVKGPADWFTGTVRIDPLFDAREPGRASGAAVTFEPGARSNWHTYPLGQTLVVTSGVGYVQSWGGPVRIIKPGDIISCPANEKHWHGAAPKTAMTHIAIQESRRQCTSKQRFGAGSEANRPVFSTAHRGCVGLPAAA